MIIGVYGQGCVGAITAACLAEDGREVIAVDSDAVKVDCLRRGIAPVHEPGLADIVRAAVDCGRLRATTDVGAAAREASISLVCVGTPAGDDGAIDLAQLDAVCAALGSALTQAKDRHLIVIRSTAVPGTARNRVLPLLEQHSGRTAGRDFGLCVNPEFLREGSAVDDFRNPPKTLIGELAPHDGDALVGLYRRSGAAPFLRTDLETAELLKYADNAWHALKIGFANEIGALAKAHGIDGRELMREFARDTTLNISPVYLRPGSPFGGRCLTKDLSALRAVARALEVRVPVLDAIATANEAQFERVLRLIETGASGPIGIIGAGFKPGVDDTRGSVYVRLATALASRGHSVRIYDRHIVPAEVAPGESLGEVHTPLRFASSLAELIEFAQTLVLCHDDAAYLAELRRAARPSQRLVDLAGVGSAASSAARYCGAAW